MGSMWPLANSPGNSQTALPKNEIKYEELAQKILEFSRIFIRNYWQIWHPLKITSFDLNWKSHSIFKWFVSN